MPYPRLYSRRKGSVLFFYRKILEGAEAFLKPSGYVFFECPYERIDRIGALFDPDWKVDGYRDLQDRPRVLRAEWKGISVLNSEKGLFRMGPEKPKGSERNGPAQILLALSKAEVREILSFAIEGKYGLRPFEAASAKNAIEALADHGAIRLVICEHPGISDVLFRHIISLNRRREKGNRIQVIVCTDQKPTGDTLLEKMNILGFASWTNLIDSTLSLLSFLAEKSEPNSSPSQIEQGLAEDETCRIKTSLLIRVGVLKTGVYVRLSPTKFVKIYSAGDEFEQEDYTRILTEKKIEYLYLRKDEIGEFLLKFKQELLHLLSTEILSQNVRTDLLVAVHETTRELLNKLGATREVQEVVKANIGLTVKAMAKSSHLGDILKRFEIDREKYISSHSVLLPQIACSLALTMEWSSEQTLQKLALAAFLHDVPLTNDALAAVMNLTELARKKDQFTPEEMKAFKSHPVKASEMVKNFQEVPADVDVIVLQHHERPDGSGFPRGLGQHQISPLAAVFIVAHDIVSAIYDKSTPFVLEKFIADKKNEYHAGNFKKLHVRLVGLKL